MDEVNKINRLIFKYGVFLIVGYLLSDLLVFIKFKFGGILFRTFEKPDTILVIISYSLGFVINLICGIMIWKDMKKQGRISGLIIVLTLINFLVGIVVFLLKTINDKKTASA